MALKSFIIIRKKSVLTILAVVIHFFWLSSCREKSTSDHQTIFADSVMLQYKILTDSIDKSWDDMIAEDDDKHLLMKRLLLEVSYTNNYDKKTFEELTYRIDQLNKMRYDQQSMTSSSLIDQYDSATWALSDEIATFVRNHPRFQDLPLMEELINDINEKNNFVLRQRIRYDRWVKRRNEFVKTNGTLIETREPELNTEPMPLFELPS